MKRKFMQNYFFKKHPQIFSEVISFFSETHVVRNIFMLIFAP